MLLYCIYTEFAGKPPPPGTDVSLYKKSEKLSFLALLFR